MGEGEAGFEVPEGVAVEVGACGCLSVRWLRHGRRRTVERDVPASQRRRHGSLSVFHFCQIVLGRDEEGGGICSSYQQTLLGSV